MKLDKIFGNDGLKPGIIKMFLDPFHEGDTRAGNDNGDPRVINLAGFDHTTTTEWMRSFAKQSLARTRQRGDDLQVIVTIYGPAPWMTKQKFVRGRDLDPAEKYECAEYLISWAKYLRDVEGLPVNYISLHNEGEDAKRWPADGSDGGLPKHDHNMLWPTGQVVDFIRFLREMLDEQQLQNVGITPGETSNWERFYSWNYATAIADDPQSLKNLGLITSHGFGAKPLPSWSQPGMAVASVKSSAEDLTLLAFAANGTKHPDAFVVINTGQAKTVSVQVLGIGTNRFAAFRTVEKQQDGYTAIGEFTLNDGAMEYQAPGGSVTTFFGITP